MRKLSTVSFVIALAVLVTGLVFLSSGPAAWATSNQSPAAQTVPTPVPGGAVGSVTPTQGATVKTADDKVVVTVPAGAAPTPLDIAVTPKAAADAPALPPAQGIIRSAFTITAFQGGEAKTVTFQTSISVCTTVTQADMDAVKNNVANLVVMRFLEDTKTWNSLTTTVDPPVVGGSACARTLGLSTFALAAKGQIAPTATPAPKPTPTAGLPTGDSILSGGSGWWTGLAMVGMLLVLFGGFAIRRTTKKRNI